MEDQETKTPKKKYVTSENQPAQEPVAVDEAIVSKGSYIVATLAIPPEIGSTLSEAERSEILLNLRAMVERTVDRIVRARMVASQ